MKTYWKIGSIAMVSALALGIGSTFVAGQSTTPSLSPPSSAPPATTVHPGPRAGAPNPRGHQIHMDDAIVRLREARYQLDLAEHDKGGYRDKAIASIDQAIKDTQDGIDYAAAHLDEFPGRGGRGPGGTAAGTAPRGTARGPRGTSTTTTTATPST